MGKQRRVVVLNDTRVDQHHGCSAVMDALFKLAADADMAVIATAPAHTDWRQSPEIRAAIEEADLVLVNGEGTLHHDARRAAPLLAAAKAARALGKPSALINATWQAMSPQAADLAKGFDLVSVRESASAAELAAAGVDCRIVPDLALFWDAPIAPRAGVAYTDNAVRPRALDQYRLMWRLGGEPLSLAHGRRDLETFVWSLRTFLPRGQRSDPMRVLEALRGAFVDRQAQVEDREALMAAVAGKALVVTGRFHMLIFCLAAQTPFLAIASNTHKLEATVADAGLAAWRCAPVEGVDAALIERASRWRDDEPSRLAAYVATARDRMRLLFSDLSALSGRP